VLGWRQQSMKGQGSEREEKGSRGMRLDRYVELWLSLMSYVRLRVCQCRFTLRHTHTYSMS
jgi:hypothetical protein